MVKLHHKSLCESLREREKKTYYNLTYLLLCGPVPNGTLDVTFDYAIITILCLPSPQGSKVSYLSFYSSKGCSRVPLYVVSMCPFAKPTLVGQHSSLPSTIHMALHHQSVDNTNGDHLGQGPLIFSVNTAVILM